MTLDIGVIIACFIAAVITIIGYLLSKKDALQESQINDLYEKHETDSVQLHNLSVKLAENYHAKSDIKDLLDTMKVFLNDRFNRLEDKLHDDRRDLK